MEALGRLSGRVVRGNNIGKQRLGAATANIEPVKGAALPGSGVYISRVALDGRTYWGVTNIGKKPTVAGDHPIGVETHIFGVERLLYEKQIEIELLAFLRGERRFDSLDALRDQIERDKAAALRQIAAYEAAKGAPGPL